MPLNTLESAWVETVKPISLSRRPELFHALPLPISRLALATSARREILFVDEFRESQEP